MAINSLKLIGKTSNEIFILRYPNTLLDFCDFDFSVFAEGAIDICNEALKTGTPDYDRISDLRHDIQSAHCYIEHNIRTTYEKIVFDCWIDFVCRRDNIGVSGMWNRYTRCKTPFEKAIFARLCEFRYNRAENEWLNIIRIQDYAKTKLDFIFTDNISKIEEAAARRNYFDLIFSVTAREMGCRIEDLGVTKLFSVGRIPTAPFVFPNISKEIVRHVLSNYDYDDDYSDIGEYGDISDQIAMDAFSRMRPGLPQEPQKLNIPNGKLDKFNEKIYMPCSLKAAVDLEIDVLIEDGSWLSRCKRCKRFFLRNKEHPEEYCSRYVHGGKTCLQIYEEEHPRPTMTPELEERCRAVTDEVYSRVDKTMSVKEYDSWHLYLEAMISKVRNGEILPSELENFLDYSLEVDISKSHPILEVAKKEVETSPKERVVKPFVPERISRSEIPSPFPSDTGSDDESDYEPDYEPRPKRGQPKNEGGFFTSPSFQRQKSERAPISHIIRNGESMGESYTPKPDPAGFTPFGAPAPAPAPAPEQPVLEQRPEPAQQPSARTQISLPVKEPVNEEPRRRTPREELKLLEERIGEENRLRREQAARARTGKSTSRLFSEFDGGRSSDEFTAERSGRSDRRAENEFMEIVSDRGRQSAEFAERRERDSYPQSRRERERSMRRQQEQSRQSDLSLVGYGEADTDLAARFDRAVREDRNLRRTRNERDSRDIRNDSRDMDVRGERGSRYEEFEVSELDRLDDLYDRNNRPDRDVRNDRDDRDEFAGSRYNEPKDAENPDYETDERADIPDDPVPEAEETAPRRRTVKKNAAALSAYGKMSGTSFSAAQPERENIPRTRPAEDISDDMPDPEPFKDIGSIFEVLEQSQSGTNTERRRLTDDDLADIEPSYERETTADRRRSRRSASGSVPSEVSRDNAPEGFWTEDRHLFRNTQDEEPQTSQPAESAKEKKSTRSNKTQRLVDAIMREPDDNPNFRK